MRYGTSVVSGVSMCVCRGGKYMRSTCVYARCARVERATCGQRTTPHTAIETKSNSEDPAERAHTYGGPSSVTARATYWTWLHSEFPPESVHFFFLYCILLL